MRKTIGRVAAIGAVVLGAALVVPGAEAAERKPARVTGSAEFVLPFYPDQDVRRFSFDAVQAPWSREVPGLPGGGPTDATGTVRVSHRLAAENRTVRFEATVDCLMTSPGYANLTAIVTRADPEVADRVGTRVGFSVQDGGRGHDRVGFTWDATFDQDEAGVWGPSKIGTCLAVAPFNKVTRGDYVVRHAELTAPTAR